MKLIFANRCVTHHHACDCREYAHLKQLAEFAEVLTALGALKGPEGWTVECRHYDDCEHDGDPCDTSVHCRDCTCHGTGRIPIDLPAPGNGKGEG